jgi:hypothetical protein
MLSGLIVFMYLKLKFYQCTLCYHDNIKFDILSVSYIRNFYFYTIGYIVYQ